MYLTTPSLIPQKLWPHSEKKSNQESSLARKIKEKKKKKVGGGGAVGRERCISVPMSSLNQSMAGAGGDLLEPSLMAQSAGDDKSAPQMYLLERSLLTVLSSFRYPLKYHCS